MDRITGYKKFIREVVEYIYSLIPTEENVETQLIIDEVNGHYLLFSVGWENDDYREYSSFVHIDIKETGRVWIQHDGTDLNIAQMLVEKGIPKSDIVLGFREPEHRKLIAEFAIE